MRSLWKLIAAMSKAERIFLAAFLLILTFSLGMLLRSFYTENTQVVARQGGTFIEGSVGELQPLNPWFLTTNDVNHDIAVLIFAGLMKYDAALGQVVDDLATVKASEDNRTFTAVLKPDLLWHDSTPDRPHPITSDDVVFTFKTIQDPGFPNPILQQNFRGVTIEKVDARTVRFRLSKPYSFFKSNLTLGLLPAASFDAVPVNRLQETLDFGFHPIGAGPYAFQSLLQTDLSSEVTLKRFDRPGMERANIERVVFRVFSDFNALLADIANVNAVRGVPRNQKGLPILPKRFRALPYTLPQYVGVFFNMDRPVMADHNVRLGLQLGTNKQEIADAVHETRIVDTPLLELDLGDWRYAFDAKAANGAFFDSSWNQPEKVRLQRLLEQRNANAVGPLSSVQRIAYLGTGAVLTLTGSTKGLTFPVSVNGIRVETGSVAGAATQTGSWTVRLPAGAGMSGSLRLGMNVVQLTDSKGKVLDSAFLERYATRSSFALASEEQRLVDRFVAGKQLPDTDPKKLTVQQMTLDHGFLRIKQPGDPLHTRINAQGKELLITLLTSRVPETYPAVAAILKRQWEALGARVVLDIPDTKQEFQEKLLRRQYDAVLFGQSLLDNLDSYPYWHSSQMQEKEDPSKLRLDAFNLSQYASFEADSLLARIRDTGNATLRASALKQLNNVWKKDVPAVMLYAPMSIYAYDASVHGVELGTLSLHSDRFSHFAAWYVNTGRQFIADRNWASFPGWVLGLLH